jgi:hypothetical protein
MSKFHALLGKFLVDSMWCQFENNEKNWIMNGPLIIKLKSCGVFAKVSSLSRITLQSKTDMDYNINFIITM